MFGKKKKKTTSKENYPKDWEPPVQAKTLGQSTTKVKSGKRLKKSAVKSELSPTVQKADELRRQTNKAHQKLERLIEKWISESSGERSSKKREEIDKKYEKEISAAEQLEDKAYDEYHKYVKRNFPKKTVEEIVKEEARKGKGFMGKGFITRLGKSQSEKKKPQAKRKTK